MTGAAAQPAEPTRTPSQQSASSTVAAPPSIRSVRSHRSRARQRLTSQESSSTSSIADIADDKSLTSFPSFSPGSPMRDVEDEAKEVTLRMERSARDGRQVKDGVVLDGQRPASPHTTCLVFDPYDGATLASSSLPPRSPDTAPASGLQAKLTTATSSKSVSRAPSPNPSRTERWATHQRAEPAQAPPATITSGARPASIVESLTAGSPWTQSTASAGEYRVRNALFEEEDYNFGRDATAGLIPGGLHNASDEHVERLLGRHGSVSLVRQLASDLARRDAQMAALRRRTDERERALRKLVLECGLSSLELETRLRAMEKEGSRTIGAKENWDTGGVGTEGGGQDVGGRDGGFLAELMTDAMTENVGHGPDATIRGSSKGRGQASVAEVDGNSGKRTVKGWKELFWGTGTVKKTVRARDMDTRRRESAQTVFKAGENRRPTLQDGLFRPPEPSRASGVTSQRASRTTSLASLALRLVAADGAPMGGNEGGGAAESGNSPASSRGSLQTASVSSAKTGSTVRNTSSQFAGGSKASKTIRRSIGVWNAPAGVPARTQPQERWDIMESSPGAELSSRPESYGPVEMDTILPLETQPPTLTHIYNNYAGSEYLTDRFGFIYDQRRKRRQREAAQVALQMKGHQRHEMLTNGRGAMSPETLEGYESMDSGSSTRAGGDTANDTRLDLPVLTDADGEGSKHTRWQDYLKIATFQTELLSHTPSTNAPGFEVTEGSAAEAAPEAKKLHAPPSSGHFTANERGFVPAVSKSSAVLDKETAHPHPIAEIDEHSQYFEDDSIEDAATAKDDAEPVQLLLRQLSDVHDALQREKTVRWNDFLRKVRAEKRREGEAAAAAAAAAAEARFQKATTIMPETRLSDGELIGVASLGVQGKIGRAKASEFRSLILGGIPVAFRSKVWSECSGARALRIPGYYDDLVARPAELDDSQVVIQIGADITRTLTDNIFFRKGPGVAKLREVLLCYARRNPDVGYCQGMNLIAANLLLIMPSAEDAFWVLVSVVEHILPPGYYDHSLAASRADQHVLRSYVAEVLPRLSVHFDALAIDLDTMTFPWFLSLFTDCLSAEALFRVWDVVLCQPADGGAFLFQVALALLKLNERALLGLCGTPAQVYTYINHKMTNHAISIDGLVQASEGLRRVVRKEDVEERRRGAMEEETEVVMLREERLRQMRRERESGAGELREDLVQEGLAGSASEAVEEVVEEATMK